jgi:hypothetical protein
MADDTLRQLEDRIARLEEELRQLQALVVKEKEPEKPWWERTAGMFKDSKVFDAIVREGRKIREAERRAARAEEAKAAKKARPRKKRRDAKAR